MKYEVRDCHDIVRPPHTETVNVLLSCFHVQIATPAYDSSPGQGAAADTFTGSRTLTSQSGDRSAKHHPVLSVAQASESTDSFPDQFIVAFPLFYRPQSVSVSMTIDC